MSTELGDWLREQRLDRHWSRADMARKLIGAAGANGDDRWEKGQYGMHERYKLIYCRALGVRPAQFGPPPDERVQPHGQVAVVGAALEMRSRDLVAYRGRDEAHDRQRTATREVLMAAHEASDHAEDFDQSGTG